MLLDALPPELTFGMPPARPASELAAALGCLPARYVPECLAFCEMAFFCRHEAAGGTAALGVDVREQLGGVDTVAEALGLADGTLAPADDQAEAAALLQTTARVYASALATAASPTPARSPRAPKASKASPSGKADKSSKSGSSGKSGKARGLWEDAE